MNYLSKMGLVFAAMTSSAVFAADLELNVYNPGNGGIFPVSSVIVSGEKDAILFDAQFSTVDSQALVEQIKASGKKLKLIYISSGDPDYYFGLEKLVEAFPDVEVVASPGVVEHIQQTKDAKLEYWGPILKEGAPHSVIVPKVSDDDVLYLEGEAIEVKEMNTHQAYLWIPSMKAVLGGVSIYSGEHVWTADSQTKEERSQWVQSLEKMKQLEPTKVIPGHYKGEMPEQVKAVQFTIDYLNDLEQVLDQNKNPKSTFVIEQMKQHYPNLESVSSLELSAKVLTGEMPW